MNNPHNIQRWRLKIEGLVQGVGFRPFIYRIACELGLRGWVRNDSSGVIIEVEGDTDSLEVFLGKIYSEKPPLGEIYGLEKTVLEASGYYEFSIIESGEGQDKTALVLPDMAVCKDCLREVFDIKDRRYLYPFTNCTNCGPRYWIITGIPYDRKNTTMSRFVMCDECSAEYENPFDRRFHAQPNACPKCGPEMELWDKEGKVKARKQEAMKLAAEAIRAGKILALKGLGGFQLAVDARNEEAVKELRMRKHRPDKALAVMMKDLRAVKAECEVCEAEEKLLSSPQSPIVLLRQSESRRICAPGVNPKNPYLGAMLAYTPMHHILMRELGFPIVATSGNLSEEPICTDEREALSKMGKIADLYLVHNRPIKRPVDDSVAMVVLGETYNDSEGSGVCTFAGNTAGEIGQSTKVVIAVGGHQKNTTALGFGKRVFVSQHIGDLENVETFKSFRTSIEDLQALFEKKPDNIVCDLHPDYLSTKYAQERKIPLRSVQHHYAHILSCMAENSVKGKVLGVAMDGTGYGVDGTIWGGEFLEADYYGFRRIGHLRRFRLPGGEKAAEEPIRCAAGVLYELFGDLFFAGNDGTVDCGESTARRVGESKALQFNCDVSTGEIRNWIKMLERGLNSPWTSSAGRLFDAVSAMLGIRCKCSFEGQAAMELEFAAKGYSEVYYKTEIIDERGMKVLDWEPMIREILTDLKDGIDTGIISMKFHRGLTEGIVKMAENAGIKQVCLSGGCFQNRLLTELAVKKLREKGFTVFWHHRMPPNDGGIALGQIAMQNRIWDLVFGI